MYGPPGSDGRTDARAARRRRQGRSSAQEIRLWGEGRVRYKFHFIFTIFPRFQRRNPTDRRWAALGVAVRGTAREAQRGHAPPDVRRARLCPRSWQLCSCSGVNRSTPFKVRAPATLTVMAKVGRGGAAAYWFIEKAPLRAKAPEE